MKLDVKSTEFYLLLLVCLVSLAANLPSHVIAAYIDQRLLLIVLSVVVIIALLRYLRLLLFLCVTALAVGANLPERLSKALNVSTDIMLGFLALIILIALLNKFMRLPTGVEKDATQKLDNEETRKAILIAISIGNIKRLRWLIKHNLEINFSDNGVSPVVAAAEKGNSEVMQLLIYHGADVTVTNAEGKTPLKIAETLGFTRTAEIIKFALDNKSASLGETAAIAPEYTGGAPVQP